MGCGGKPTVRPVGNTWSTDESLALAQTILSRGYGVKTTLKWGQLAFKHAGHMCLMTSLNFYSQVFLGAIT